MSNVEATQVDPTAATPSKPTPRDKAPETDPLTESTQVPVLTLRRAVLSLGSNLGNRLETLQGAVDELADTPGVDVKAVSPVYETDPFGGPDQPQYYNVVITVETLLRPKHLLERANAIEEAFQRVRTERWGPRTLDVDIVWFEGVAQNDERLTLPHPRAHERSFVLAPWADVEPDAMLPGHGRIADLLAVLGTEGVSRRDDVHLTLER